MGIGIMSDQLESSPQKLPAEKGGNPKSDPRGEGKFRGETPQGKTSLPSKGSNTRMGLPDPPSCLAGAPGG